MELGARFWLSLIGIAIAVGVGIMLVFWLVGATWYAWGLLGTFVFFGLLMLVPAWIYDRRHQKTYE
jgi:hypothetical protein